mgnify:CR=1 FL=1
MAKVEKVYKVLKSGRTSNTEIEGTLEYLTNYFGYTLECGNSWNSKIQRKPKTIASLVKFVNMSYDEKREYHSSISLIK